LFRSQLEEARERWQDRRKLGPVPEDLAGANFNFKIADREYSKLIDSDEYDSSKFINYLAVGDREIPAHMKYLEKKKAADVLLLQDFKRQRNNQRIAAEDLVIAIATTPPPAKCNRLTNI